MKLKYLTLGANYNWPHALQFAEADAAAIYSVFQSQNLYRDIESEILNPAATAPFICEMVKSYSEGCSSTDCLMFYFAGYGLTEEDVNGIERLYLICNDTDLAHPDLTAIRLDVILKHLEDSKANIAVALLDCCFSGYGGRSIIGPKTLRKIQTGRSVSVPIPIVRGYGRLVLAACGRNEKALESPVYCHGLFTAALIEALSPNSIERSIAIASLYHLIQTRVLQMSRGKQCPSMYGGDHGAHLPTSQKGRS